MCAGEAKSGVVGSGIVDREGSVWMGVREGFVVQLQAPRVRNFGPDEGAPGRRMQLPQRPERRGAGGASPRSTLWQEAMPSP